MSWRNKPMKIQYLSHSAFILSVGKHTVAIDPFLEGNPTAPMAPEQIKADFIVVTHAHPDHFGDALAIARANGSTIISCFEIATFCQKQGVPAHPLHIGGGNNFPFGRVKLTIAHHGSAYPVDGENLQSMGIAAGALVSIGGKTIYHAGDTGLFMDMKLIGEMNSIDVALLPIGDNFTMDINDAVKAAEFVRPALAIPMHYDTFDIIKTIPDDFVNKVEKLGIKARKLDFGEHIDI